MTKSVRVENADTAPYKVLVQTWDKGPEGEPDRLVSEVVLGNPADMTSPGSTYITSTRYLVIKEA